MKNKKNVADVDVNSEGSELGEYVHPNPKRLKLKVLLIEDSPTDATLMKEFLRWEKRIEFDLMWQRSLKDGIDALKEEGFDIILLDLNLPDSDDIDTVVRMYEKSNGIPIIVLTGNDNIELALEALNSGAQDYIVKGRFNQEMIVRAIRYTVERQELLKKLDLAREEERRKRDFNFFRKLEDSVTTKITARTYGASSIKEGAPDIFKECVELYRLLLQQALEQNAYKVDYDLSEKLRKMAETIGFLNGGPRDVIEIHSKALKDQTKKASRMKSNALMEEGRLIVLQLMGHLVAFYRKFYLDYWKTGGIKNE